MDGNPRQPRPAAADARVDLTDLSREALIRFAVDVVGTTPHRGLEVYKSLWQRGARGFDEMPTVGKPVRRRFAEKARVGALALERELRSEDGTVKFLWRVGAGQTIESVLIPDPPRLTLCMSSQVGCAMACTFCLTGDMGLARNLRPGEIALQVREVQRWLHANPGGVGSGLPPGQRVTNLVMMGMGEPLHNLDNLVEALRICLDDHALNFSHRRITVSTVGLVPQLERLSRTLPVNLAVSINATTDALRGEIMPINRRYDLRELLDCCRRLPLPPGKRITFGYVLFAGVNDTLDDAARLHALVAGVPAKINLIPYNENPDRALRRPSDEAIRRFQNFFVSRGVACHVRTTRGIDISAACGQLGIRPTVARGAEAASPG